MRGSPPVFSVCLASALAVSGCGFAYPAGWAQKRVELAAARHPAPAAADAPRGRALDIELLREGGLIRLINREPRRFDGARLWLNQQYAGELADVPIGPGPWVSLDLFLNRHGESFPRARFLRPDLAGPVILAELVTADPGSPLHPLTVLPSE